MHTKGKMSNLQIRMGRILVRTYAKQFFNSQSNNRSNKHKEIIRQSEEMIPQ